MEKLVVTLAMLGNVPTRKLNPNTPITSEEIVKDIQRCEDIGISLAHMHARDENEEPTQDRAVFEKTLNLLKASGSKVITQVSTGARGGGAHDADYRGQMLDLCPEMASVSTGSSNFAKSVNANSPQVIEALLEKMRDNNVRPEVEIFDAGMLDNARKLLKRGLLTKPVHFNLVMGVPGSMDGTPRNLMFLVEGIPSGCSWSVCGIGRSQVPMLSLAMMLGGHVRTGLEDTLLFAKDVPASNPMLVERVHKLAKEFHREIATPDEAREILGLSPVAR